MHRILIGAAALAVACVSPALAQTTQQFMVAGAPVTVGTNPASEGKGYSVYHYKQRGSANSVQHHLYVQASRPRARAMT
jgi:hypothetical protein